MKYQTFKPGKDLDTLVKCYWTLEGPVQVPSQKQVIVPDGCMEMIFHIGDLYKQYMIDGKSIVQPRCFVFGQLTRPLEIEPTGESKIFSARFHPDGFLPFATMPVKSMENTAVPLTSLFGKDGRELEQTILPAGSDQGRIELLEQFLLKRLTDVEVIDRTVKATVETILTANGQLSIDEVARRVNINRRQLERKFSTAIGLSPKQLSRIVKLQATLKMLLSKQYSSLTELAYDNDYYDQAHFIRNFKEFTGFTPKEFYGDSLALSSLFYSKK